MEAAGRRCDHGDRLDMLERDVINTGNSIDVLRMGMGGKSNTYSTSGMDNVVIASLRGAVDGLCKREFSHAAAMTNVATALADMSASVSVLEDAVSADADSRRQDVVANRAQARACSDAALASCMATQARLIAGLRAELESVGKAAMEHARAGRADIDAMKSEISYLKACARAD